MLLGCQLVKCTIKSNRPLDVYLAGTHHRTVDIDILAELARGSVQSRP